MGRGCGIGEEARKPSSITRKFSKSINSYAKTYSTYLRPRANTASAVRLSCRDGARRSSRSTVISSTHSSGVRALAKSAKPVGYGEAIAGLPMASASIGVLVDGTPAGQGQSKVGECKCRHRPRSSVIACSYVAPHDEPQQQSG